MGRLPSGYRVLIYDRMENINGWGEAVCWIRFGVE